MKTIRTILYSLLTFYFMMGCQPDLLDTLPNDRVSSDIFWQTERDAEFAANAMYPTLDSLNIIKYDGITDLLHTNWTFAPDLALERGSVASDNSRFLDEWNNSYKAIRRANDFMDNVDDIDTDEPNVLNTFKGEVMTIRAYHYIKLAMLFGNAPLITTGIEIEEGRTIERTDVEAIWDFIETELDQAEAWLPLDNGSRVSKGTANGLKARAMLFAGRYAEAAEAAEKVMDSGVYSLYPSYFDLFQYEGEGNEEILLDRQYATGINTHNIYGTLAPWSQIGGSTGSQYVPTGKMADMYEMTTGMDIDEVGSGFDPFNPYENRDPRMKYSMFVTGVEMPDGDIFDATPGGDGADAIGSATLYSTTTGYNVRKYVDEEDFDNPANSGLNIILLRYAEVLLTYAEAKIELNEIDQSVYDAINEVRQRESVNMPLITTAEAASQAEMREVVRKERAVELAFEGLRLFDIRRWGIAEEVMQGNPSGMWYVAEGVPRQLQLTGVERNFNPARDYLWPIPQRERELNPNLIQNPNW